MSLLCFPNEVLCQIFACDAVLISDLSHLMLSCRRFHSIIRDSNDLWKRKFNSRWPKINFQKEEATHDVNWLERVVLRLKVAKDINTLLLSFSSTCYPVGEPQLHLMKKLTTAEYLVPEFSEDELLDIIFHKEENEQLNIKYYARKVLRYLRSSRLEKSWKEFITFPESEKSLLKGAVLISQWGQMDQERPATFEEVEQLVENISHRVMKLLEENKIVWISEVNGGPRTTKKVLEYINHVLYDEMGFQGNQNDYYALENSYIDKVLQLRKGIPLTLCLIYHEVAKRLGIRCEPVSFPQHFLLRWREYPERDAADSFTYIDAFNGGASHQPRCCPALIGQPRHNVRREAYASVPAEHVFQRMVNNLIQCSKVYGDTRRDDLRLHNQVHFSRLACAVSPGQTPLVVAYAELCVYLGVQLEEAMELLQAEDFRDDPMMDFDPNHWTRVRQITSNKCVTKLGVQKATVEKRVPHCRSSSIIYAIGLVMKYTYSNLGGMLQRRVNCVIISWDDRCKASEEWVSAMGIQNLNRGIDQPFYHVLSDDGTSRYVAEDNLEISPFGTTISHPDIGIHFQRFDGRRYVPNDVKRALYPEDDEVALSLLG